MKNVKRVALVTIACLLLMAQVCSAATVVDGTWFGEVTVTGSGEGTVKAFLTFQGDEAGKGGKVRLRSGTYKGQARSGDFLINEEEIIVSGTVFGVPKQVALAYEVYGDKLYLAGGVMGEEAVIALSKVKPAVNKVTLSKKPAVGATRAVYAYANDASEYAVLIGRDLKIIGITDDLRRGQTGLFYRFLKVGGWKAGTNKIYVRTGIKDAYGKIPISARVGQPLTAADKLLLSPAKTVTIKDVK